MAHEINNPVAIMIEEAGWVSDLMSHEATLMLQSPNRQEYQRALEQISVQGQCCKEITHKLLDFARRTDATAKMINFNDLVREVVEPLERPASYTSVGFALDLNPSLPLIATSPSELQQALVNLIKNSFDAMAKTGGSITIAARHLL